MEYVDTRDQVVSWFKTQGKMLFCGAKEDAGRLVGYVGHRGATNPADNSGKPWVELYEAYSNKGLEDKVGAIPYDGEEYGDLRSKPSGLVIPERLLIELDNLLCQRDDDIRKISTIPIKRAFMYIDVSDFSTYTSAEQVLIINSLVRIVRQCPLYDRIEAKLCIGDGYILVANTVRDMIDIAAFLAYWIVIGVAHGRENGLPVGFHFRMSVHWGDVHFFYDMGRIEDNRKEINAGWNYIGDGINGGQRILAAIGKDLDDVLFVSHEVIEEMRRSGVKASMLKTCDNRGRRKDKHDKLWRVYQMNYENYVMTGEMGFMNPDTIKF